MNIQQLLPAYTRDLVSPFAPDRAVRLIVEGRMNSANARGNGNKAAKREAIVRSLTSTERQLHEVYSGLTHMGLTAADVDKFAERWTESRTRQPRRVNSHD